MKFLDLGDDSASTLVSVSAKKKKNLSSELDLVEAQARAEAERSRLPRQTIVLPEAATWTTWANNRYREKLEKSRFREKSSEFRFRSPEFKNTWTTKMTEEVFRRWNFQSEIFLSFRRQSNEWFTSLYLPVCDYKSFLASHVATSVVKLKPRTLVFTF